MASELERIPYKKLGFSTASALTELWAPGHRLAELSLLRKGKRNSNYRIRLEHSSHPYVLRIYADPNHGAKNEYGIHTRLRGVVPMPELLFSGTLPEIFPYSYAIFEFVQGRTLDEQLESGLQTPDALFEEIGENLARVHEIKYPEVAFLDEHLNLAQKLPPLDTWYDLFLSKRTRRRLGAERSDQVIAYVKQNAHLMQQLEREIGLVHGDFRPENLVIRANKLVAIIDWEFAMAGHLSSDLGQFIRKERWASQTIECSFIRGYQRGRHTELPSNWRTLARFRDLANLLQLMDTEEERPRQFAHLTTLIDRSLNSDE